VNTDAKQNFEFNPVGKITYGYLRRLLRSQISFHCKVASCLLCSALLPLLSLLSLSYDMVVLNGMRDNVARVLVFPSTQCSGQNRVSLRSTNPKVFQNGSYKP